MADREPDFRWPILVTVQDDQEPGYAESFEDLVVLLVPRRDEHEKRLGDPHVLQWVEGGPDNLVDWMVSELDPSELRDAAERLRKAAAAAEETGGG